MAFVACNNCGKPYPNHSNSFLCECGGVFDFKEFPPFLQPEIDSHLPGVWKFIKSLGLPGSAQPVTLGEGGTPLIQVSHEKGQLWLKLECENPTGSYKDRGSTVLVSHLMARGVKSTVEDSSGNAGASFAAYCARGNLKCRVFVPESASGPKRKQIEMVGAELVSIPGPRAETARAVLEAAKNGEVYGSHAFMPFGLTGIATIAYELVVQLGNAPACIIAPVGHGGLLYGMMRGFEAMMVSGVIEREPFYVGVQSEGCAPLAVAWREGKQKPAQITPIDTLAEGVRVVSPVRGESILVRMGNHKGKVISVSEEEIKSAYVALARIGIYCEPTSALVWAAINYLPVTDLNSTVAIITGSGYKSNLNLNLE